MYSDHMNSKLAWSCPIGCSGFQTASEYQTKFILTFQWSAWFHDKNHLKSVLKIWYSDDSDIQMSGMQISLCVNYNHLKDWTEYGLSSECSDPCLQGLPNFCLAKLSIIFKLWRRFFSSKDISHFTGRNEVNSLGFGSNLNSFSWKIMVCLMLQFETESQSLSQYYRINNQVKVFARIKGNFHRNVETFFSVTSHVQY
jgi:hypothetical protein